MKAYAFMRGGRIYTLQPIPPDPLTGKYRSRQRYRGFMDGECCGFFNTKKEFEAFVQSEPNVYPDGGRPLETSIAVVRSEYEGRRLLNQMREIKGKPKPKEKK